MFAPVTNMTGFMPDEGKYTAECLRIEEAPDNGFGVGVRWVLALYEGNERILQGDGTPMEFWQTTSTNMGPKARARAYVEAFLGRPLDEGERINPNDIPGKRLTGMVIHEDSTTKVGQKVAKLVSVKPLTNGAAKVVPPQRPTASSVSADASDADIDRATVVLSVEKKIRQAELLGTAKHLDWLAMDLTSMDVGELQAIKAAVQQDIDAD
jgi:hypothetical protein